MYFVGVDAGGTKTSFVLSDAQGKIAARYESGSGRFFEKDAEGIYALAAEGLDALCRQAALAKDAIACAGFGFPGYGEKEGSEQAILEACERALGSNRVICECDCYMGWAGSLAMNPGVNIVSGTGAICYGVNEKGETARSSGWGAYCDEGSCRWLGSKLIQLFAKQADGRMPRTVLYEIFRAHFSLTHDAHFIYPINHVYGFSGAETAKLQMLLKTIYDAGDPHAALLYQEAAAELWLAAKTVAQKLNMGSGFNVSYSGGLFKAGACILDPLKTLAEQAGARLTPPRFSPELGAVLAAMRHVKQGMDFGSFTFTEQEVL